MIRKHGVLVTIVNIIVTIHIHITINDNDNNNKVIIIIIIIIITSITMRLTSKRRTSGKVTVAVRPGVVKLTKGRVLQRKSIVKGNPT